MPLKGQTASPETRAKISAALNAYRARTFTQPRRKKHTGGRQKKVPTLPHEHPLAADISLHETLCRTGISWLACEQMRDLRKQGVGLAAIANFFGVNVSTVALVSSWTDLSKIKIYDQTAVQVMTAMFGVSHRPDQIRVEDLQADVF